MEALVIVLWSNCIQVNTLPPGHSQGKMSELMASLVYRLAICHHHRCEHYERLFHPNHDSGNSILHNKDKDYATPPQALSKFGFPRHNTQWIISNHKYGTLHYFGHPWER